MEFEKEQPQLQVQMLIERPQDLERIVTDVQILKSPIILFIKSGENLGSKEFIYWFGYTLGKTRIIFWGTYRRNTDEFKTKGICTYNELGSLNDTIHHKLKNGFEIISQLTEDKITPLIQKYQDEKENVPKKNRSDIIQKYISEENRLFFEEFSKRCLKYIEHNIAFHQNTNRGCLEIARCRFKDFGCDQYNWGIEEQHPDDTEIDIT